MSQVIETTIDSETELAFVEKRLDKEIVLTDRSINALKAEIKRLDTLRISLIAMKHGVNMDAVLSYIEEKGLSLDDVIDLLSIAGNKH